MFVNPIHRRLLARLLTVVPSRLPIVMMLMMMMVIMMNTPCKSPHAWGHVHRFFISFTIIPSLVYHSIIFLCIFHNFPSFPGNHFSIFFVISIVYNLAIVCHQVGFPNVENKYFPTISQMWKTNISYFC